MWDQIDEMLRQSVAQAVESIVRFLPGLIALVVAVLFAVIVAWVLGVILRRSLRSINFDARLEQWGLSALADWAPSKSPTLLLTRLTRWAVVLIGLLVGASALNADLTYRLVTGLFAYFPDVLAALVVLIVGAFVAKFLARSVLISAVNLQIHSARLLSLGVKWLVLVLTGAMALDHLGIGGPIVRMSFAILFGGIVLALALAVGLGSKDMVSRTWEKQSAKGEEEQAEKPFQHL